jgi:hypothetical protein
MSGILDNIGRIGCACQRGCNVAGGAAAPTRQIFPVLHPWFPEKPPGLLTVAAIGINGIIIEI